ncbi:MAG TPA: ferritin-like domain-containing protein [Terriglobia bacterium]|nr:ferritin-like domain-containing protein [Terriglobia bacterium]
MADMKKEGDSNQPAKPERRNFMKMAGMTGIGLAGATLIGGAARQALAQNSGITDADILNFALNLEYLEAEFYTVATTGKTIAQMGIPVGSNAGQTTGGGKVNFKGAIFVDDNVGLMAEQIAYDEQRHVLFIQNALKSFGLTPVSKPAINLNALNLGFANLQQFLTLARAFEDVGVTAYAGAAPLISNSTVLGYAARILAAEAEHAGAIREQVMLNAAPTTKLDGVDILPPPSGQQYFSLDLQNAMCAVRTPGQVLYIVYGFQANVTAGGFFPAGVNGVLNMSSAPA